MSLICEKNLKMLPKINIVLPSNRQAMFQHHRTNYDTTLVLQCKIMQHSTGGAVHY